MSNGMKQTEIGEIPVEWEVAGVDDFIQAKKGAIKIGPFGSQLKKDSFVAEGIKVYGQENIFVNSMLFGDRYITEEHFQRLKSCELFPGDFIISMMGTIGKCMVVPAGIQKGIMDSHLLRLQLNQDVLMPEYLSQMFGSPLVLDQVNKLAVGGIMAGLSSAIVKNIKFIIPTLPEQQKIAEILSTVDKKIAVIEEQLVKTTELKTGLMQRLLAKGIGHTEFKDSPLGEIPKGWEVKSIGDYVINYKRGAALKPSDFVDQEGFEVIPKKAISKGGKLSLNENKPTFCTVKLAKSSKESIVNNRYIITTLRDLVPSGPSIGYMVEFLGDQEYLLAQGVYGFELNDELDKKFLIQFSNSKYFRKVMQTIMVGSTQVHIRNQDYFDVLIPVPEIKEQSKIAKILSTVDEKIQVLHDKKSHYQTLKRGLMQQLLTGKLRVLVTQDAVAA